MNFMKSKNAKLHENLKKRYCARNVTYFSISVFKILFIKIPFPPVIIFEIGTIHFHINLFLQVISKIISLVIKISRFCDQFSLE